MTQFERIKELIASCEDPLELIGIIDGMNAGAKINAHTNDLSIEDIKLYLESDVKESNL